MPGGRPSTHASERVGHPQKLEADPSRFGARDDSDSQEHRQECLCHFYLCGACRLEALRDSGQGGTTKKGKSRTHPRKTPFEPLSGQEGGHPQKRRKGRRCDLGMTATARSIGLAFGLCDQGQFRSLSGELWCIRMIVGAVETQSPGVGMAGPLESSLGWARVWARVSAARHSSRFANARRSYERAYPRTPAIS